MPNQNLGMFPLQKIANPYGNPPSPFAKVNVGGQGIDPDPCPNPAMCWNGVACVECEPNVNPTTGTSQVDIDPDRGAGCNAPAGGCPPGTIWQQSTCDCVGGQIGGPREVPGDRFGNVPINMGVGGGRGSLTGVQYGAFGRSGGGAGGGAMTDLEVYQNPMLEMGSPFLGKNVSAFNKGGRMRSPYYDNGGQWQEIARAMNGMIGLGQAANVMQGSRSARPMPRRRFVKGGRF